MVVLGGWGGAVWKWWRERGNCIFIICGPYMTNLTWKKFNPCGGHMERLTVKRDWSSTRVFFKHFGYFEYRYESVVSSRCPMLLGGYLEGRLGPLYFPYSMWQKFNPRGSHMGRLTVKRDWPSTRVFFKHFDHFKCKYEPVVSSGCSLLLGGYLEGRLGPLPPHDISYVAKI